MKVVQVVTGIEDEASGPSYSVPGLCGGLLANNCQVELHKMGFRGIKDFSFPVFGYQAHRLPIQTIWRSPEMLAGLMRSCATADILHSNSLWTMPNVYPAWVAKKTKCKLVVAPRGALAAWSLRKGWLKKKIFGWLLQNRVLRRADMFHATSEKEYEEIRALGYKQPVAIVPIGMEIPRFEGLKVSRFESLEGHRLRRVVFFGRLHKVKAVDHLVRAWELLTKEGSQFHCSPSPIPSTSLSDWELVIAGPDCGIRGELEQYIADHKIPRVRFVGEINGPAKYEFLSGADLYVLPSFTENFGVTVAEALACGTPVIVSKGTPWQGVEGAGGEGRGRENRSTVEFVNLEPGDTFDQIEQYLRQRVAETFENKTLGIFASIGSKRNANELAKHMAAEESPEVHKFAAKNIGALFERGVVGFTHLDKKAMPTQRWITRFVRVFSSFDFAGERFLATLTLKAESSDGRLYAVEAVEINQDVKLRSTPRGAISKDLNSAPILNLTSQLTERIAYYVGDVNRTHPAFLGRSEPFSIERAADLIRACLHHLQPSTATSSRCGWWVDNDPETLAKTLRAAMTLSDDERRRMGEVGREWIRRDFSWEGVGAKMKAAYEWLLDPEHVEKPEWVKV